MKQTPLKIALGQIDIIPGKADHNESRIIQEAKAAAKRGVDIIVFPEMSVSGYLLGDLFEDDAFVLDIAKRNTRIIRALAAYDIVIIFGSIGVDEDRVGEDGRIRKYNAAFVGHRGEEIFTDAGLPHAVKTLHPNYRVFDDTRHFFSLRTYAAERGCPIADLLKPFTVRVRESEYKLGVMLCEDMWDEDYSVRPGMLLKENGADLLINLSCSPWSWRKNQKRDRVVRGLLGSIGLPFIYVNNVGCQNNGKNFVTFDGGSTVYNKRGEIVSLTLPYEDRVLDVTIHEDMAVTERTEQSDVKQIFDAVCTATRGYIHTVPERSLQKVVIGLSGGIDSAVSAALFTYLLGPERVIAVNMPYKGYSSSETQNIAKDIADRLRIEYRVVPVQTLADVSAMILDIEPGSSAHKSIQARMRMEVLAGIASSEHGIFTCNANKTEIAFGYGTLGGDLRGYFAPWMDCLKQDVYRVADYFNCEVFKREVIPEACLTIEPMDELSKGERRGDPFCYGHIDRNGYHDEMIRAVLSFRKNPEWFLERYLEGTLESSLRLPEGHLTELFETDEAFVSDLTRCVELFFGMNFKRVQSVPGALVDKRSFGFDYRESILEGPPFTDRFYELKNKILSSV